MIDEVHPNSRSFPRKRESRGRFNKPGPPPSAFALRRDQTAPKLAKRAWAVVATSGLDCVNRICLQRAEQGVAP
jgi:hypothetical protein